MIRTLLSRLGQMLLVMAAVTAVAFVIFRYVGDPVLIMSREDATPAEKAALRQSLGLDQPVVVQFAKFLGRVATGDLGLSFRNQRPVAQLIAERLPATLELVFVATLLALALGIPLGVWSALRPDSWITRFIQSASLIGISTPTFVTGSC